MIILSVYHMKPIVFTPAPLKGNACTMMNADTFPLIFAIDFLSDVIWDRQINSRELSDNRHVRAKSDRKAVHFA